MKHKHHLDDVTAAVIKHIVDRGWDKENVPRGIAISLSLEVNELLEHYQ